MDIKDIEKSMFRCKALNAKITPNTCINNQKKTYKNKIFFFKKHQFNDPCFDCKKGKKILPGDIKKEEIEFKICRTYKYNPDLCKGHNNGKFYREHFHSDALWKRKKHCNDYCYRIYYRKKFNNGIKK